MRQMKLSVENLSVQSFATSATPAERGTVVGHAKTGTAQCGSAFDACQTGLCTFNCPETYSPDACPTYPEYCVSADDACPSGRGCTVVGC